MLISTNENPDIEEILNGPDYFECKRFNVRMPKKACVLRQEGRHVAHSPYMETMTVKMSLENCQGCEQGKEIKEEVGSRQYAESTSQERRVSPPQKRRGKGRRMIDFSKVMEELGFITEKEMFECLLKDWDTQAVADLVGCHQETVHARAIKFGIEAKRPKPMRLRRKATPSQVGQEEQKASAVAKAKADKTPEDKGIKVKTCRKCKKMKPLEKGFYRHRYNKDGYEGICKQCRRERSMNDYDDKKKQDEEEKILMLDLNDFPDILQQLKRAAKKSFREVEMQALAYIDRGLMQDMYFGIYHGYLGEHTKGDQ